MTAQVVVTTEEALRWIVAAEVERQMKPVLAALAEIRATPKPTPLVTPQEFARLLAVHPRTLHRMELGGDVPPAMRIGAKTVRWRREVIDDFVTTGRVNPLEKPLSIRRRRGSV